MDSAQRHQREWINRQLELLDQGRCVNPAACREVLDLTPDAKLEDIVQSLHNQIHAFRRAKDLYARTEVCRAIEAARLLMRCVRE